MSKEKLSITQVNFLNVGMNADWLLLRPVSGIVYLMAPIARLNNTIFASAISITPVNMSKRESYSVRENLDYETASQSKFAPFLFDFVMSIFCLLLSL